MNVGAILGEKGNKVVTASPDDSLQAIAKILREHGIGCIVVSDGSGAISGIVSERDLVRAIAESGPKVLDTPVSKCMTKNVVTCMKSDTIDAIMAAMTEGRFRHMPVIEDGKLAGVISIGDVVRVKIAETEYEAAAMRSYIATG